MENKIHLCDTVIPPNLPVRSHPRPASPENRLFRSTSRLTPAPSGRLPNDRLCRSLGETPGGSRIGSLIRELGISASDREPLQKLDASAPKREPLQKLGAPAPKREPLQKLGEAERPERPERAGARFQQPAKEFFLFIRLKRAFCNKAFNDFSKNHYFQI